MFAEFWLHVQLAALAAEGQEFRNSLIDVTVDAMGLHHAISRTLLGRVLRLIQERDSLAVYVLTAAAEPQKERKP